MYLGIDPGQSGGIAILRNNGQVFTVAAMPKTERDIATLIAMLPCDSSNYFAYIEKVHAMPKQGVSSSFKFGMSYGALRMALIAHAIPFQAVPPGVWQRKMGCIVSGRKQTDSKTDKKNMHKARAQELFPQIKVTHAIADALLIAECCRRDRANA